MDKKSYVVPEVEVLEIAVEQGFAVSNGDGSEIEPGTGEDWPEM